MPKPSLKTKRKPLVFRTTFTAGKYSISQSQGWSSANKINLRPQPGLRGFAAEPVGMCGTLMFLMNSAELHWSAGDESELSKAIRRVKDPLSALRSPSESSGAATGARGRAAKPPVAHTPQREPRAGRRRRWLHRPNWVICWKKINIRLEYLQVREESDTRGARACDAFGCHHYLMQLIFAGVKKRKIQKILSYFFPPRFTDGCEEMSCDLEISVIKLLDSYLD